MTIVRKGQAPAKLDRNEFHLRFMRKFYDPAYGEVGKELAAVEEVAWKTYVESHKAPVTVKAGPGFADPDYDLSVEWKEAHDRLLAAEARQKDPATRRRILLINASARNDGSCPSEISKTWRLARLCEDLLQGEGFETDLLDLSLLTSDYERRIHPCKACVSTAMPLCHWPCSCYPNHSLNQDNDWMNEIYERWVSAHGVIILTPTYWYQTPAVLKLMIDRLVCADGGNPDPSSTHGKKPEEAKELEKDWDYPKHLAGRAYGLVVHGDVAGIEPTRRSLSDWLDWMGFIDAGFQSQLDRYVGYYESYAESHDTLDRDTGFQEEVRNVARAVANTVRLIQDGKMVRPDAKLKNPRQK
ncbi:NADPH-dependent FMN reductase [Massilia forsythiae]|uniref:NADPH-dependent FMN reductase n=1 Tax=Massilia forsythiae TaxID=2728020 RepID=A0A7Z2VTF1_9BURK|nr:flavodoxin family protein [Massilia forsythiae]QJD98888.1 NADPH-dependent FMN reductase [Massilia forsythiae]